MKVRHESDQNNGKKADRRHWSIRKARMPIQTETVSGSGFLEMSFPKSEQQKFYDPVSWVITNVQLNIA
ncbi:hypothetical protein GZ78_09300 [Endozoicomonas numazuensis]|uniref:Uncharacterized protein n=1 Tax=Endozoicomonas numazuensis TaxID=1137799 RepID=A0A081NHB7_9GAMM|nr:hypothetical protein GZ78_09300 [Endozoicomonas numazuensis]